MPRPEPDGVAAFESSIVHVCPNPLLAAGSGFQTGQGTLAERHFLPEPAICVWQATTGNQILIIGFRQIRPGSTSRISESVSGIAATT